MAGRIVKIAKGGFQKTAEKDISYYAKNINTNASGSVSETGGDGVMFGSPKSASWEMPDAEFPDYSTSYQKTMPKEVASNSSKVANKSTKTTETNSIEEDELENSRKIKLTIAVFFDGTLNNKYNTTARWLYKNVEEKILTDEEKKQAKTYKDRWVKKLRGSYENDLSNVARLEENYIPQNSEPSHFVDKIYIEGVGTFDGTKDDLLSAKDGEGDSGIRAKIRKAIQEIGPKITDKLDNETIIDELTFNVYGFSRGAATARNFIYEITQEAGALKSKNFIGQEQKFANPYGLLGEVIDTNNVEKLTVNFAGLFDTVSSHDKDGIDKGVFKDAHDDVEELHLDAVGKANKIVHFTAADEHRENFALTDISKSRRVGDLELSFPGVHADIGGCYTNGLDIVKQIVNGFNQTRKKEQEYLIEQGWFKKEQFTMGYVTPFTRPSRTESSLSGERYISRNYSFIPLEFMAVLSNTYDNSESMKISRLSKKYHIHSIDIKSGVKDAPALELKQKQLLSNVKKRLYNYVFHKDPPMAFYTEEELVALSKDFDLLRKQEDSKNLFHLRNQFLHFSADYSGLGMDPYLKNGQRTRKVFHG